MKVVPSPTSSVSVNFRATRYSSLLTDIDEILEEQTKQLLSQFLESLQDRS